MATLVIDDNEFPIYFVDFHNRRIHYRHSDKYGMVVVDFDKINFYAFHHEVENLAELADRYCTLGELKPEAVSQQPPFDEV